MNEVGFAMPNLPSITAPEIEGEKQYDYRPYITLVQALSPLAGPEHNVQSGSFVIHTGKDSFDKLGTSFDCFALDMRYRASRYTDNKLKVTFDRQSELFQEIQAQATANPKDRSVKWGHEYLLFIAQTGQYASFFCNNPTLRNASSQLLAPAIRRPITIKSAYIKTEKGQWYGIAVENCSEPFQYELVEAEALERLNAFTSEVKAGIVDEIDTDQLTR